MIVNWRGNAARKTQFTAPAKSAETLQRTTIGVFVARVNLFQTART